MNENSFNAYLSKEFRTRHNRLGMFHVKASDKFTAGVSDFLLWGRGVAAGLETKFVKTINRKGGTLVLDHTFTGPQLTFLESLILSGSRAYGLVAVEDDKKMFLFNSQLLPESGNWTVDEFVGQGKRCLDFSDIDGLIEAIFAGAG